MVDGRMFLTVVLALLCASLIEHMVIAPRMAHSPTNEGIGALPSIPTSLEEAIKLIHPDVITVSNR